MKQLSDKIKTCMLNELESLMNSNDEFNVNKYSLFLNARNITNEFINYLAYRKEIDKLIIDFCTKYELYFKRMIHQSNQNNFINYCISKKRIIIHVKVDSRNRVTIPVAAIKAAKWKPGDVIHIFRTVDPLKCVTYKFYTSEQFSHLLPGEHISTVTIEKDFILRFTPCKTDHFIDLWVAAAVDSLEVY